jgi:DNA-binding XRE family transcriptional regulator
VVEIRDRYAVGGITQDELGRIYGVARNTISSIVTHTSWKEGSITAVAT